MQLIDKLTCCMARAASQVAARNGCAAAVSVVARDAGLLQRGHEVRTRGVNLVVADFFDAGVRAAIFDGANPLLL